MSYDTYAFIEHVPLGSPEWPGWRERAEGEPVVITTGVSSLSKGPLYIDGGGLLSAIAGVRPSIEPLHKPRGWPAATSQAVANVIFRPVLKTYSHLDQHVPAKQAERWIEEGHSVYAKLRSGRGPMYISSPDTKVPGWLHLAEIYAALEFRGIALDSMSVNFRAAMGAMKTIGDIIGPDRVRMTFWAEGSI